jgi:polyhydroxyalkanoate synthase
LWGRSFRRFLGEEVEPVVEPEPGDNRFKDPDWSNSQYFDFWKQAYLITSRWASDVTKNTEGVDDRTRQKAVFYLEQMLAALSPSNYPFTNPEVVRATLETNAENLVRGMAHLAHDLEQSKNLLRITQTDLTAFEVGRDLAITPGKVIFQNDLIQLIQYSPTTEEVYERPLIMVPPWINKYYILDLVPEKSFVKFAVDQGFTVFMVSWVNPDGGLAQKTFEDYMNEGILAAVEAVNRNSGCTTSTCWAIASAARCWPRLWPMRRSKATTAWPRQASSPRRSTSARRATCSSSSTTRSSNRSKR